MLSQVTNFSSSISQFVSTPIASPIVSIAGSAANLVLASNDNRILVDFTFNLFSVAQINQAGGMPLGLFKRGGMIIAGLPTDNDRAFWANEFRYDHASDQIEWENENSLYGYTKTESPYLIATVLTAETIVPSVVLRRSQQIIQSLSNPETLPII
jgi:hypothetical protein